MVSEDNQDKVISTSGHVYNREDLTTGQRVFVVEEIISTEQSYVFDLKYLVKAR